MVFPCAFAAFPSILHPPAEPALQMPIKSVCVTVHPETHPWLLLAPRVKSRVLTGTHTPLLGVPSRPPQAGHTGLSVPEGRAPPPPHPRAFSQPLLFCRLFCCPPLLILAQMTPLQRSLPWFL